MNPPVHPEKIKEAIRLQTQGYTQVEIAEQLGISERTVRRHLTSHNRRLMLKLTSRAEAERARQVTVLAQITSKALRGFERSAEDAVTIKVTSEGADEGSQEKTETTTKGQAGAPAFLAEARGAMADVRKILGLDEPTDDETNAAALESVGKALDIVLSAFPIEMQKVARAQASAALLSAADNGGSKP